MPTNLTIVPSLVPSLEERDFILLPHNGGAFFPADQTIEGQFKVEFVWAPQADFVERGRDPLAMWEHNERVVVEHCSGCISECSRCSWGAAKIALEDTILESWNEGHIELKDVGVVFEGDEAYIVGEELHGFVWEERWFKAYRIYGFLEFEEFIYDDDWE